MGEKRMLEPLGGRGHAVAGAHVNAHGHFEPLCLCKKRKEIRIVEIFFRRRNRRRGGDGDELELFDRAAKLPDRFRRVLNRDRGHTF